MATADEDRDVNMEDAADGCEFMKILEGSGQPPKEGLPKNVDTANFFGNMEVGGGSGKKTLLRK